MLVGCIGGVGRGNLSTNGLGGGGGHGGKGGDAYYDGELINGGVVYGDADLPCELGSGSGNDSLPGSTAGGGIIGMFGVRCSRVTCLFCCLASGFLFFDDLWYLVGRSEWVYES